MEIWSTPEEGLHLFRRREHPSPWTHIWNLRGRDLARDKNGRFPNGEWMSAREALSRFVGGFVLTTKMTLLWSPGSQYLGILGHRVSGRSRKHLFLFGSFCMGLFVRHLLGTLGLSFWSVVRISVTLESQPGANSRSWGDWLPSFSSTENMKACCEPVSLINSAWGHAGHLLARCHILLCYSLSLILHRIFFADVLTWTVLKTNYPSHREAGKGGLHCILTMHEFSFGVERLRGKSGFVNCHQSPNPALCLHSASSLVWENRGSTHFSPARCFWKQFSLFPSGARGVSISTGGETGELFIPVLSL